MEIKNKIKEYIEDTVSNYYMSKAKKTEIHSIADIRRTIIANSWVLTEEQENQIDNFFVENYGEKVGCKWHRYYAAHAGKFDYRFFPELLYGPEFERFQNVNKGAVDICTDKNFLPLIADVAKVRMPSTIVSCTNGVLRDGNNHIITPKMVKELVRYAGKCFIKPSVESNSGRGCAVIDVDSIMMIGDNYLIIKGTNDNPQKYSRNFVIQKLVKCHDSISSLYACSVNTFRVITYLWKNKIEIMPIIIRIGQGGHFLDNAHQGGMFCAVYENGTMGDFAVTEFNKRYIDHPDTHVVFSNHRIEHINKVIASAKRMHEIMPQLGVVNWDFTVDSNADAVLIEANCHGGSVWLPQMAHGVGAFGDRTEEVLQWLRFMKSLKPHERGRYVGGLLE